MPSLVRMSELPTTTTSGPTTPHRPQRGDEIEAWLKRMRDRYDKRRVQWHVIDRLLDRYRECSDYGLTLRPDDDEAGDP